jgi:hypothetical protein
VIFFMFEICLIEYNIFEHFSKAFSCIWYSNERISKLTYTFKGVVPPKWFFGESALVSIDSH